jgi:hypothetical protein
MKVTMRASEEKPKGDSCGVPKAESKGKTKGKPKIVAGRGFYSRACW